MIRLSRLRPAAEPRGQTADFCNKIGTSPTLDERRFTRPLRKLKKHEGNYYVGEKMPMSHRRMAALKKCTDGIAFDSDRYVACMSKEGEAP